MRAYIFNVLSNMCMFIVAASFVVSEYLQITVHSQSLLVQFIPRPPQLQLSQAKSHRHAKPNIRAVATGNWGCGHRLNGDVQLKLLVQWMAASVAGLPCLMYYTDGHKKLSKVGFPIHKHMKRT